MLWEHEPPAIVSTAFSSSPKLLRVFLEGLDGVNLLAKDWRGIVTDSCDKDLQSLLQFIRMSWNFNW